MEVINKNVIVKLALCVLLISIVYIIFINITKPKEVKLDDVIVKENKIDKSKTFAVMIQDDTGEYTESETNSFPTDGYKFNKDKSGCVNSSGNVVENALSYNNETNKINLKIQGSVNCYVYYDKLYTVTYELDGGEFTSEPPTKELAYGDTYRDLPEPTKDGYTFLGWNGKNLLNYNNLKSYAKSVDITVDNDGYISDSTPTTDSRFWSYKQANWHMALNTSDYILTILFKKSALNIGGSRSSGLMIYDKDENIISNYSTDGGLYNKEFVSKSFSSISAQDVGIMIKAYDGVYRIQLEEGDTSTEWEPYYIESDTKITQRQNHTLKAIWEKIE